MALLNPSLLVHPTSGSSFPIIPSLSHMTGNVDCFFIEAGHRQSNQSLLSTTLRILIFWDAGASRPGAGIMGHWRLALL